MYVFSSQPPITVVDLTVKYPRGCRSRDRMVVGFTAICAISEYHHSSCELEPRYWRVVLDTKLCHKICQLLATGRWFSPGTPDSSTNKTDRHNITEILLNVALNTINHQSLISECP